MLEWLLCGLLAGFPHLQSQQPVKECPLAKPRRCGNMFFWIVVGGINKVVNFLSGSGKGKAMVLKVFGRVSGSVGA